MSVVSSFARTTVLIAGLAVSACATNGTVSQRESVMPTNAEAGLAVKGYDPVGYFADGKPERGNPAITTRWHGATHQFTSDEHRRAFLADPDHFAP